MNPPNKFVSHRGVLALVAVVVAIYAVGIGGAVIVDQSKTPEYEATAKFKFSRPRFISEENEPKCFNESLSEMQSSEIIQRVIARLSPEEMRGVLSPHQDGNIFSGPLTQEQAVGQCCKITTDGAHRVITFHFRHPNKALAVKVVNIFADEIKRENNLENTEIIDPMVEKLAIQLEQIKRDITELKKRREGLAPSDSEYETLSKEIKIREDNYAALTPIYERKKADIEDAYIAIRLIAPATASDEPVNRNLGLAVAAGAAGATVINMSVVTVAGIIFIVRRRNRRERPAT